MEMKDLLTNMFEQNIWNKAQVYGMLIGHWKKQQDKLWKPEVKGNEVFVITKGGSKIKIDTPVEVMNFLRDVQDGRVR